MKRLFCIAAIIYLATAQHAAAQEKYIIDDDKFTPVVKVEGPARFSILRNGLLSTDTQSVTLRSWIDKTTHIATHQIYVDEDYTSTGWHFYVDAHDDKARDHPLNIISQNVISCQTGMVSTCDYDETFGIDLTDAQVREYASTGLDVKIDAKDGTSLIINIPAKQLGGQLAVLNNHTDPSQAYSVDASLGPHTPVRDIGMTTTTDSQGLIVVHIDHSSPMYLSGVRWADGITALDGKPTKSEDDFQRIYDAIPAGTSVALAVTHNGHLTNLSLQMPASATPTQ